MSEVALSEVQEGNKKHMDPTRSRLLDASGDAYESTEPAIDPLLLQLPAELKKFVKGPADHRDNLAFVERSGCWATTHRALSVLGCLMCGYSFCRMTVVLQGEIGLTQFGDEPELLKPGRHVLLAPWNELIAVKKQTEQVFLFFFFVFSFFDWRHK